MHDERLIHRLLEDMMESGIDPETACREHPELLADVRARWKRIRAVESEVEALFPSDAAKARPHDLAELRHKLPQIEGYEIESFVGSGGMGVVYKAHHIALGRPVAIKMLLPGAAAPQELECLLREARAVAALRHPHIVQVHDVGNLHGRPYFAMEFLDGGTLSAALGGVPQDPRRAAELGALLAGAVQAAHDGGIVHRDLKPGNILLSRGGEPKVADFSLARRLDGDPSVTQSSARVGTPSYMAPEQVTGDELAFCPAVDVYALGTILYELLTGRPPFRAATIEETKRQVVSEEPAPPAKLNSRVPRDLETICLACLRKDPLRRYATANAIADDLGRFLRGEPIRARPVGRVERLGKWTRRRPALATTLVLSATLLTGGIATAVWYFNAQMRTAGAVAEDLREVSSMLSAQRWSDARTALERARTRLGSGGSADVLRRIADADRDLALVARLDGIRLKRSALTDGRYDRRQNSATASRGYAAAFAEAGLRSGKDASEVPLAERVRNSSVCPVLVESLDDWAACCRGKKGSQQRSQLLEVARLADPDPAGWRDRARDAAMWDNGSKLAELAETMPAQERALALPLALAERMRDLKQDSVPFLRRIQLAHPGDFWANFSLGMAIGGTDRHEALRFFQTALGIRPETAVARSNVGVALGTLGKLDESIANLREAIRMDPSFASAHTNLGNSLLLKGEREEAMAEYRRAVDLDPLDASMRSNLGKLLAESGRLEDALEQYRAAVKEAPDSSVAQDGLGLALQMLGRLDEALAAGEEAVRLDPASANTHLNLGLTFKKLRRQNEALAHLERAVALEPADAHVLCALGSMHLDMGRYDEAVRVFREAARVEPESAPALHGLGMALGESRDIDAAAESFVRALAIDPSYAAAAGALGQVRMLQGRPTEARELIDRYLRTLRDTDPRRAGIASLLARSERMARLESILDGALAESTHSSDADELVQLAELCRAKKRYADAVRLYVDAFASAPKLAEDLRTAVRYNAACAAVRAAATASGTNGSQLRERARSWLSADLDAMRRLMESGNQEVADRCGAALKHWRSDPDLAGIRDTDLLHMLNADERATCEALWARVGDLMSETRSDK